ncbi:MAG: hypothetical protein Q7J34_03705 [Bacteroidales bacterium]|jgi:hypothetical protein|nr:hypothetical protein [Bacteroidales bacterium]
MDYFKQHKILWMVLVFLIAANITSLIILLQHIGNEKAITANETSYQPGYGMLLKTLGADSSQKESLLMLRENMLTNTTLIREQLNTNLALTKKELSKESSDTAILSDLADQYGQIQAKIRKEVYQNLLEIKKQCKPGQKEKLKEVYEKILKTDTSNGTGQGKKHRHRYRGGQK